MAADDDVQREAESGSPNADERQDEARPRRGDRGGAAVRSASGRRKTRAKSSPKGRRVRRTDIVVVGVLVLVTVAIVWWRWGSWQLIARGPELPSWGVCRVQLDRATLDRSLGLGRAFLVNSQTEAGNFNYEYDWRKRTLSPDDNQVRQAGALWGLALLDQDAPDAALHASIERGIAFFARHERRGTDGRRCVAYPGDRVGTTGTVALLALAHVDYLRALEGTGAPGQVAELKSRLDGYLRFLVAARNEAGVFFGDYDPNGCTPSGSHSPYSDGEALLALTKAAKYVGRDDLAPLSVEVADAGYRLDVEQALAADRDSDTTKGFYQWSSMSFFELATSGWPATERFGSYVMDLADWMIDTHHTLWRSRNTAYAYEGIIHAYEIARLRGDPRQRKYACVIDAGLQKLTSWQVGGPIPNAYLRGTRELNDPFAVGGVQNEARAPALRIDVTQHQMHAVLLARRYVYR